MTEVWLLTNDERSMPVDSFQPMERHLQHSVRKACSVEELGGWKCSVCHDFVLVQSLVSNARLMYNLELITMQTYPMRASFTHVCLLLKQTRMAEADTEGEVWKADSTTVPLRFGL